MSFTKTCLNCVKKNNFKNRYTAMIGFLLLVLGVTGFYFAFTTGADNLNIVNVTQIDGTTLNGPTLAAGDGYGKYGATSLGDLDGDGVVDIAIGAFSDDGAGTDRGAVHIHFMNADGSIKSTVEINDTTINGPTLVDYAFYGIGVENIGDLDDDGVIELAVGSSSVDLNNGRIFIHYLNTDGSVKSTIEIDKTTLNGPTTDESDGYGVSIANIGDLNDDGVQDLVVGAYGDDAGGNGYGAAHIHFMNTDGSIDSTVEINATTLNGPSITTANSYYGYAVEALGDLDGDDVEDIVVSEKFDDVQGSDRGAIHIHYLNANGSVKSTVTIDDATANGPALADNDYFGASLANLGDLDGNGVVDLGVGAEGDDTGGLNKGAYYILFMNADGSLDSTYKIDETTTNGPTFPTTNVRFGTGSALAGDFTGDTTADLLIGMGYDTGSIFHFELSLPAAASSNSSQKSSMPSNVVIDVGDADRCYKPGDSTFISMNGRSIDDYIISDNVYFQNANWQFAKNWPSVISYEFEKTGDRTLYLMMRSSNGNRSNVYPLEFMVREECGSFPEPLLPEGVSVHNLIKLPNDGNPETQVDAALYYVGADGKRHVFWNKSVYDSWYCDFNHVKEVAFDDLASIPLGESVTYRPGKQMLSHEEKIYVLDHKKTLHHLLREDLPEYYYGAEWKQNVISITAAEFGYYTVGEPVFEPNGYSPTYELGFATYPSATMNIANYFEKTRNIDSCIK